MGVKNLIEAQGVTIQIENKTIVEDVSFELPLGKFTILIGPNGAGKSTLIRALSGFQIPNKGKLEFLGKPLESYKSFELAKIRAVMRQSTVINFPFTVAEVVMMGCYQRTKEEATAIFKEVLELTECEAIQNQSYLSLSGGQRQRVQLARALMQILQDDMQGNILFLDEPTAAFDLYHQQKCLRLISDLCNQRGMTAFCVLHDLNLTALYGDNILLLAEQKIQIQGSPEYVINEPIIKKYYQADLKVIQHHCQNSPQIQLDK